MWHLCSLKEDVVWYTLLMCTSDRPAAGTDADVFVTVHGTEGSSPRVKLPSRPEDFLRGNTDTFRMQLKALGEIVKLTVGHNNRGYNPAWHLDHAEVTDEESGGFILCDRMQHQTCMCVFCACLPACFYSGNSFACMDNTPLTQDSKIFSLLCG